MAESDIKDDIKDDMNDNDMQWKTFDGYVKGGHDIEMKKMTVEQAKLYSLTLPGCVGFTYSQKPSDKSETDIWFKNNVSNIRTNPELDWKTCLVPVTIDNIPKAILERCLVLSICIEDFGGRYDRVGCELDVNNIRKTFGKGGYGYPIIENDSKKVTSKDFDKLIEKSRKELTSRPDQYNAFLFFISSHGNTFSASPYESAIILSDGSEKAVTQILDKFRNSDDETKGLGNKFLGKPKIFIFQACRGSDTSKFIESQPDNFDVSDQIDIKQYVADQDIVLVQANTQGYVSWRNSKTGSYLITETTKVLSKDNKYNRMKTVSFDDAMYHVRNNILENHVKE
eukprot:335382_1